MRPVFVTEQHIAVTLDHLQRAGQRGTECVVLWLGQEGAQGLEVAEVYRPDQYAEADVFRIPPTSMASLLNVLSSNGLMIAAQVHSHPLEAFHSKADDAWAIVRHLGALSLVLPHFALKTRPASFFTDVKVFQLTAANRWRGLHDIEVRQWVRLR